MTVTPEYTPVKQTQTLILTSGADTSLWVSLPSPGPAPVSVKAVGYTVSRRTLDAELHIFDVNNALVFSKPFVIEDKVDGPWVSHEIMLSASEVTPLIPGILAAGGRYRWEVVSKCGGDLIGCGNVDAVGDRAGSGWVVPKPCTTCG